MEDLTVLAEKPGIKHILPPQDFIAKGGNDNFRVEIRSHSLVLVFFLGHDSRDDD